MRTLKMLAIILITSLALFAADSPFNGTWKLNAAKSKLPPPGLKDATVVVHVADDAIIFGNDIVTADGQQAKVSYAAKFDGKDYPVSGDPHTDSISLQRVNANTLKGTAKKDGKVAGTFTVSVSKDGKVTTVEFVDSSQEKPVKGVAVYDKYQSY
jgi:hypothetical protein